MTSRPVHNSLFRPIIYKWIKLKYCIYGTQIVFSKSSNFNTISGICTPYTGDSGSSPLPMPLRIWCCAFYSALVTTSFPNALFITSFSLLADSLLIYLFCSFLDFTGVFLVRINPWKVLLYICHYQHCFFLKRCVLPPVITTLWRFLPNFCCVMVTSCGQDKTVRDFIFSRFHNCILKNVLPCECGKSKTLKYFRSR